MRLCIVTKAKYSLNKHWCSTLWSIKQLCLQDWSNAWLNIPQLKLGKWYSSIFEPYIHYDKSSFKIQFKKRECVMVVTEEGNIYLSIKSYQRTLKRKCIAKYLKDDKHLYFAWKYAYIFVLGHYLFLEELCSQKTLLILEQRTSTEKYLHIFTSNRLYCLYITIHHTDE